MREQRWVGGGHGHAGDLVSGQVRMEQRISVV